MENVLMTSQWSHGGAEAFCYGMLPAWTPMLPLTSQSGSGSKKKPKYSYLEGQPGLVFTPVAVEISGVLGPLSLIFLKELGHNW